jgi:uncharacterized membrane protein YraQ (UPF0718 family)
MIPVYVVTGFLDAGKTTFLNNLLNKRDRRDVRTLVLQFEAGEEALHSRSHNCESLMFSKRTFEEKPTQIKLQIRSAIESCAPDEIWVEWNGILPFSRLQALLLSDSLRGFCKIHRVIHVADGAFIENLMGRTGGALPEQLASSDFAVVRNVRAQDDFKRIRRLLSGINPGVKIYRIQSSGDITKQLFINKEHPVSTFVLTALLIVLLYLVAAPLFLRFQIPIPFDTIINVFLGILLQAVPFLLIGVLLSSAIGVFVPQRFIESRFPKSLGAGVLAAILASFCLPVCDCASIPIFRSLVKKGIPLPVAVTFMTVTPVINPVVILSTYYAFSGNMAIVVGRICFGIVASTLIGLCFAIRPPKGHILSGGALDKLMCSCGCYEDADAVKGLRGKLGLFVRHSQAEFFNVGKYLLIGTFIAAVIQVLGAGVFTGAQNSAGLAVSTVIMMAMAFVLSLCSSSDAIIARSLVNQFPMGAIMGFLVFGPMMDIKNVMMLHSGFTKRFIARLLITVFIVCFFVVYLLSVLGGL